MSTVEPVGRPAGVVERIRATQAAERQVAHELRLRNGLAALVTASGTQGFADHAFASDLDLLDEVSVWVDDARQWRSGTEFERRSLAYLYDFRAKLGATRSRTGGSLSFDDEEVLREETLVDVRRALLGDDGADFFELVCWNEANSVAEGVRRPYIAASAISSMALHDPNDRYDLIPPLAEARIQYEDQPESRAEVNDEITNRLADYASRAGWPAL